MSISLELVFKGRAKNQFGAECISFLIYCLSVAVLHLLSGSNEVSELSVCNKRLLAEQGFSRVVDSRQ